MTNRTLSDTERAVLSYFALAAHSPVNSAARALRLHTHTVHYVLKRLRERGIIVGTAPYLDLFRHGVIAAGVFFNLEARPGPVQERILTEIRQLPELSWLARLGGRFQLCATLRCVSLRELTTAISRLRECAEGAIRDEAIVLRTGARLFGRRYLKRAKELQNAAGRIGYGDVESKIVAPPVALANTDLSLLRLLTKQSSSEIAEIARTAELSISTVNRRLRELEKAGTIRGYVLQIRSSALGMRSYRICIKARGAIAAARKAIHTFCADHQEVLQLEESLGEWHFELEVETLDGLAVDRLRSLLLSECGAAIQSTELIEIFEHLHYNGLPDGLSNGQLSQ